MIVCYTMLIYVAVQCYSTFSYTTPHMYQAHSHAIQHSVLKAGNGPGDKEDTATAVALLLCTYYYCTSEMLSIDASVYAQLK